MQEEKSTISIQKHYMRSSEIGKSEQQQQKEDLMKVLLTLKNKKVHQNKYIQQYQQTNSFRTVKKSKRQSMDVNLGKVGERIVNKSGQINGIHEQINGVHDMYQNRNARLGEEYKSLYEQIQKHNQQQNNRQEYDNQLKQDLQQQSNLRRQSRYNKNYQSCIDLVPTKKYANENSLDQDCRQTQEQQNVENEDQKNEEYDEYTWDDNATGDPLDQLKSLDNRSVYSIANRSVKSVMNRSTVSMGKQQSIRQFLASSPHLHIYLQPKLFPKICKYFSEHPGYFLHISQQCSCFSCDCGECSCNYKYQTMDGLKQSIYDKDYQNISNRDGLQLRREDEQIMGKDPFNIMNQYRSESQIEYNVKDGLGRAQLQKYDDKIQKMPSLIKSSEYNMDFIRFKMRAKADLLRQEHKVVPNTRLIGQSRNKADYKDYSKTNQSHYQNIVIPNPLQLDQLPPMNIPVDSKYQIISENQKYMDSMSPSTNLVSPDHYLSQFKKGFKIPLDNKPECKNRHRKSQEVFIKH